MKKLILSVFMFALIAGASVNSPANAPLAKTPGVVATPNLILCLSGADIRETSAAALAAVAGGTTWGLKVGLGLAACVGLTAGGVWLLVLALGV